MSTSGIRRSSRIKEKEAQKMSNESLKKLGKGCRRKSSHHSCLSSPESSDSEDEEAIHMVVAPSEGKRTSSKPNNYLKVHHSYNRDYGLDMYEGDFIDDSSTLKTTPHRSNGRKHGTRKRKKKVLGSSSSDSDVNRGKVTILSSDEDSQLVSNGKRDDTVHDPEADSDYEITVRKGTKKKLKRRSRSAPSSSSEDNEEQEIISRKSCGKRTRILAQFESDEDMNIVEEVSSRAPSMRARKLKEEKEKKTAQLFNSFRANRSGEKGATLEKSGNSSEALGDYGSQAPVFCLSPNADQLSVPTNSQERSLAEKILFPCHYNSGSSSDDSSDWIVSDDGDIDYIDVKEMLKRTETQGKILYHLEAECNEEYPSKDENTGELDPPPQPLLLHEAVCEGGVEAMKTLLSEYNGDPALIDIADGRGYTALMYAADRGDQVSLKLLLEASATINCSDENGTSSLHLAALSGQLECVEMLIAHGHKVDCRDNQGWPPLLYAHFQNHQECVKALMKAKPHQISVLGDLLKRAQGPEDDRTKTLKVVRSLLVSLAHEEAYYSIFNDFIHCHPAVLEEDDFSFFKHCMGLLNFENKQAWFKRKLDKLRAYACNDSSCSSLPLLNVSRDNLLNDVFVQMRGCSEVMCWKRHLSVTFKGEAGICTGPRKEFFACLTKALARGDEKLFCVCDDSQLSLQPCHLLHKYNYDVIPKDLLKKHDQLLELIGMVTALTLFHNDTIDLHLTNPLIKQLLGLPLDHPDDLESVDRSFYHSLSQLLQENEMLEELELTFTQTLWCPWSRRTVDIPICEGGRTKIVTKLNKGDYVEHLSRFKLEESISQEIKAFSTGFWKVLPQKCLQVFTPSELTLLISGVPKIDVEDWINNTKYIGLKESDDIIRWFWRLVRSLMEDEKALLLKFVTGSPCVPVGGFSALKGLSDGFKISVLPGKDKIPHAATCFNTLKLPDYSNEQQFRNKMLIAIRFGSEGFEFS